MTLKNSPSDFAETVSAHRHLATLRLLSVLSGRSNELLLDELLNKLGIGSSYKDVHECLRFLEGCGAVKVSHHDALMVVDLTRQGDAIARGHVTQEGIAPPGPECPYPAPS
jgi:hypothetical protein